MTTVRNLYCDELYLKGLPITSAGGGGNTTTITNIETNITNVNATISGLIGGDVIPFVNQPHGIQTRIPNVNDDVNENWRVGSVWIFGSQAYVCTNNSELAAVWKPAMLEIDDSIVSSTAAYSSLKINVILLAAFDTLAANLDLKADQLTTNTKTEITNLLIPKADQTAVDLKADITAVDLKADQVDLDLKANIIDVSEIELGILNSLQEFPLDAIIASTFASNSLTYTQGNITVSGSSFLSGYYTSIAPHRAFNKIYDTDLGWLSKEAFFGSAYTTYLTDDTLSVKQGDNSLIPYTLYRTNVNGVDVGKQWISIDCFVAKIFHGFKLHFKALSSANIKDYIVCGSNDNVNFTEIYSNTDEDYLTLITRPLAYTTPYRYYRVVVNDIQNSNSTNNSCQLQELVFLQRFDISGLATTTALNTAIAAVPSTQVELDKVINLLNSWITSGNLTLNAIGYVSDPIREHY
jgi:hypothetical protein